MKRRLFILAVFLLAGAVVNVAVAWGLAAWGGKSLAQIQGGTVTQLGHPPRRCVVHTYERRGATRYLLIWESSDQPTPPISVARVLPLWAEVPLPSTDPNLVDRLTTHVDARGWPTRALWSRFEHVFIRKPYGSKLIADSKGLRIPPMQLPNIEAPLLVRHLPLGVIWPGFAVNTLFYAVVLWLLISGPFALRRFIRVKRGLCPACAYRMGESPVCSECGKALPGRAKVAT